MQNVNQIILIGHIGEIPILYYVNGETPMVKCSLAINEYSAKKQQTNTQWHTIVAWGALAEYTAKEANKGNLIYVYGKLRYDEWTDKQGKEQKKPYILAEEINILR